VGKRIVPVCDQCFVQVDIGEYSPKAPPPLVLEGRSIRSSVDVPNGINLGHRVFQYGEQRHMLLELPCPLVEKASDAAVREALVAMLHY
jgi:hypothetical protein